MTRARSGYVMVVGAACMWGCWPLILKWAESYGPIDAALESTVVMAVLTVTTFFLFLRDRMPLKATWRGWLAVAWLGVGDAGNVICLFLAYKTTSVAIGVTTHYLTPLFVAIASPFVLRERAHPRTIGAVIIAFLGLLILLRPWNEGFSRTDAIGGAFGAASAVCYATNVLVTKRLSDTFSGSELMFFHGIVATPLLALLVSNWSIDPRALGVLILGGIGPGALGATLFVWALRRIPTSRASTLTLLEPLVAVLLARVVVHETVPLVGILGAVMILGGAALVMTEAV